MMLTSSLVARLAAADFKPAEVLFETRHLDKIGLGSEVTYRFERKVSDEKFLGAGFADDIRLGVVKINNKGEREVVFKVFTGPGARDPSNWPDLTINPILVFYLDRAVGNYGQLAGGSLPYLKGKFRDALRDKAQIETIKFSYNGKDVDAFRITVRPYADDMHARKMEGFQDSKFTVVVSDEVPGYFLDLASNFESKAAAAPSLEEHISLVGMGESK
jgi:hypothetical protein